jgi:hypothetical protein
MLEGHERASTAAAPLFGTCGPMNAGRAYPTVTPSASVCNELRTGVPVNPAADSESQLLLTAQGWPNRCCGH